MHLTRRLALVAGTATAVALAPAAGGGSAAAGPGTGCFGAAARDAARPCDDAARRFSAVPSPDDAVLQPSSACTLVRSPRPPRRVCAFGVARPAATATVALLGDSHAPAWRAAVDVVARAERWRGLTVRRSSCPFTTARRYTDPASADGCTAWMRSVVGWFARHREVRTVFVVNSSAYDFVPGAGGDAHAAAVAGYREALDALPASVRRIVVIRDNPQAGEGTLPCVARALGRHQRADLRCALPRASALAPDAPAEAAALLAGDRGRSIDLTPFFCDDARCYPVVGGALVYKDSSHITTTYSRSLGPYLLRAYRGLGLAPA